MADPQPLVAAALACLLEREFRVLGTVSDGLRLLDEARRLRPALVLSELRLPRLDGLTVARRLREELKQTRVVFLTTHDEPLVAAEVFEAGALGLVLRSVSSIELGEALRAALRGERWLAPAIAGGDPARLPDPTRVEGPVGRLSPRRREVVRLIVGGHSMKQAAASLGVSTRTIAYHKYGAMKALDLASTAQLVRFAVESRLLPLG